MYQPECPFCGLDPYEYVDIGVGYEAVGVSCCEYGVAYFDWRVNDPAIERVGDLLTGDQRRQRRGRRLLARLDQQMEEEA